MPNSARLDFSNGLTLAAARWGLLVALWLGLGHGRWLLWVLPLVNFCRLLVGLGIWRMFLGLICEATLKVEFSMSNICGS